MAFSWFQQVHTRRCFWNIDLTHHEVMTGNFAEEVILAADVYPHPDSQFLSY
jgi:hypothetical protein